MTAMFLVVAGIAVMWVAAGGAAWVFGWLADREVDRLADRALARMIDEERGGPPLP